MLVSRQETIEIKLIYDVAKKSLETLKGQADELKKTLSAVNIGDAKSYATIAKAEKDLATASMNRAKAEKLSADAITAKMKAEKAAAVTATAKLKQDQQAAKTSADQAKADLANAKTKTQLAKADTELAKAESIRTRQAILLNREQERQSAAMRRLGQDIGQVNASQAQSIQYMSQWIRQQEGLSNATVHATGAINNAKGGFQTYRASINEAGGAVHNFRFAVDENTGAVYRLDQGIRTTSVSLRDMSSILRAVRTVVGFTGIAQSMRSAFTEMKSMSDAMAEYRKVTGATSQEMETLRGTAYEVAKSYGESASGVIASAANMARAGYKENSLAMAELATKTKLVGDMTQEAADKFLIAVDAAYKYQGNVEQLSAILDAANEIDNNYATTISHIAEGTTLVASLAATAKVPIEQMIAALGTMQATTQRSGSEIARGYRYILLHAMGDTETEIEEGVTATEEAVQTLTDAVMKYGDQSVKSAVQAGKLINPMEKIVALQKAYKEGLLTDEALYEIGSKVAGQRYYNVFSALITNPEMYNDMLQSISQSMGSAQNEIDILMDSWSKKLERLNTTWTQIVNNAVSENFIKGLIDGGRQALEFAGNLENLAVMAGGAYAAIRALTTGIKNLSAPGAMMNLDTFGRFNLGVGLLGIGITAIGAIKSAYEKTIRDMQKAAEDAVADAVEKSHSIESIANRYTEIISDGVQEEKGELTELNKLQSELNKLVGEQGSAIDLVNGKYDETRKKLRELSKDTIRATLSQSVATFGVSNLNGYLNFGNYTGVPIQGGNIVLDYINNMEYFYAKMEQSVDRFGDMNLMLTKKPDNAEEIIAFYKEIEDFYIFLGSTTSEGKKAENGAKSIGEEYSVMYNALGKFVQEVKNAANPVKAAQDALNELEKELQDIAESTEEGGKGFKDAAESAYTLEKAIEGATKAKEKFDDAMKTSKADAFNDYVQAFQTLQDEINAGRVNSTAFYASARMLLGDEAYNATGGSTEAVMAALNRSGKSGSAMQAYDILSATYKNAEGTAIEGYGAYELLTRTRGYEGKLTNENGMPYIPELSQADMEAISKEWGDLSTEYLQHFFTAALNAFDQYDITGEATDAAVQAAKTGEANAEAEQSTRKAAEGMDMVYEADGKLAQAAEEAAETVTELAEAVSEAASEAADETGGEGEGTETPKVVTPDTEQARKDAEDWLAILDDIEAAYTRINEMSVGANPDLEALFADIEKLRETITLNIQTGAGSGTSALVAAAIAGSIATINSYAKDGKISVTVASKLTGNLNKDLISIVQNTKNLEELESIELALTANETPLDEEIAAAIVKQRESITLKVNADTDQADKDIDKVADKQRTATINVKESGASTASKLIDAVANKIRTAKIAIETEESSATKQKTSTGGTGAKSSPGDSGGYSGGVSGGYGADPLNSLLDVYSGKGYASGTSSHPGGPALVNDGTGPELIVQRGSAFIANRGNPAIVNLQKGAKVFTAGETREILSNGVIPSYSLGTGLFKDHPEANPSLGAWTQTTIGSFATRDNGDEKTSDSSGTSSGKSSGGSSGPKIDEKAFENLSAMVDYIIKRIGEALDEQLGIIDKQIDALKQQKDALDAQNELEEKQKAVAEAQRDLETALSERTIRYLGEDGKWHWMADARNVQTAQENLQKAQDALSEYQNKAAYEAEVAALEAQKKALQEEYTNITDAWSKIQAGVETPTGDLAEMISAVLTGGTPQQQTGANAIRDYLIGSLLTGGSYAGNYSEALDSIAKATAGSPIMPDGSGASLAALIATGGGLTGSTAEALRVMNGGVTGSVTGAFGDGGTHINYNYFVNGMEIGAEAAQGMTLSEVMRSLTVYAGQ